VLANDASEEELAALCRIAADVPALFHHEIVTHQEKKEILRCLINHILIVADKERIDARIVWKSSAETAVFVWRAHSRHHLIRELHAQQLTVSEIKEYLAAGKTSNGQSIKMSVRAILWALRKMRVSAAKLSAAYLTMQRKAAELDRAGQSLDRIAQYFNEQGCKSPSGKPWSNCMVYRLLQTTDKTRAPGKHSSQGYRRCPCTGSQL